MIKLAQLAPKNVLEIENSMVKMFFKIKRVIMLNTSTL